MGARQRVESGSDASWGARLDTGGSDAREELHAKHRVHKHHKCKEPRDVNERREGEHLWPTQEVRRCSVCVWCVVG